MPSEHRAANATDLPFHQGPNPLWATKPHDECLTYQFNHCATPPGVEHVPLLVRSKCMSHPNKWP